MAPPPATPSPHRFLKSAQNNPTPKPSSSLRFQHPSTQQPPSSQQFAPTPRFHSAFTQKTSIEDVTSTTQSSSPLSWRPHLHPPHLPRNNEDIEEPSSDHDEDARDTTHTDSLPAYYPSSKRRRPNPPEPQPITISSSPPAPTSSPTSPFHPTIEDNTDEPAPAPVTHPTASSSPIPPPHPHPPRFVLPPPPPTTTNPLIPTRPPLILPPRRSPTPPPSALPAIFTSPPRRGQKYVPGGMAATVRDWVVEAGEVVRGNNQRGNRGSGGGGGEWDERVRVRECRGNGEGGMVLVREGGKEGRGWVLIGSGEVEVGVGKCVGVKEPIWDVELHGETWRVAVEWGVVDDG